MSEQITTQKILFVDDEVSILDSMRRQLRKRFAVVTAESGKEALDKLKNEGPFSVVVSDMRMPVMDGVQLLGMVKELYPDTVRMMLTGNADQETAIEAVNKGQIFRFLNKPCSMPNLITALSLAQRQYRLIIAEHELLDKTLSGSVKVLSELLSFSNPTAFSSGLRIRALVMQIAKEMAIENSWQLEVSALMSQIGCVTLPSEIINKLYAGIDLDPEEAEMYEKHPQNGAKLLEHIPRMEGVTHIIGKQLKPFSDYDTDDEHEDLNLCAQVIKAVFDYDLLVFKGYEQGDAVRLMKTRHGAYNPAIIEIIARLKRTGVMSQVVSLMVKDLTIGMLAEDNIFAKNGTLLAPKGQEITWSILQGLHNFTRQVGVKEPVRVRIADKTQPATD